MTIKSRKSALRKQVWKETRFFNKSKAKVPKNGAKEKPLKKTKR